MAQPIRIATTGGHSKEEAHWSNGTLAVTRNRGEQFPSGKTRDPDGDEWVITHVASGRSLGGVFHEDPELLRALAERLMSEVPWGASTEELMGNPVHRRRCHAVMREVLSTRRTEEG